MSLYNINAFFKSKVSEHEDLRLTHNKEIRVNCSRNPADTKRYLELTKKCMERTQKMTASPSPSLLSTSPKFNYAQCKYLADKLKLVVESAESFFVLLSRGDFRFPLPKDKAYCLEVFKLLYALATVVENFIQTCCKEEWIQAAMFLTNVLDHVSSIGFNLELCTLVFLESKELRAERSLTQTEVDAVFKAEVKVVQEKASQDSDTLLRNVTELLRVRKSTSKAYKLAALLSKRLQKSKPVPAEDSPGSHLYETVSSSLKQLKHRLGQGSFATVYKAIWLGAEVAKKTFYEQHFPDFEKEVSTLAKLSHPNIMSLLCYAKDKQECSIVMELMDEDLFSLIRRKMKTRDFPFDILEAVDIMLQVGRGVYYLHEMSVVHRDLKSSNILVRYVKAREMEIEYVLVKVADFGLSKIKERSVTYSIQTLTQGTTRWMAPEMIKKEEGEGDAMVLRYPLKADVYSFAMVCFEILTGNLPWDSKMNPNEVKKKVLAGDRPQLTGHCPLLLKDLIKRCWSQDASQRPSFADICVELRHLKCLLLGPCNIIVDIPEKEPANQALQSTEDRSSGPSSTASASTSGSSSNIEEAADDILPVYNKEKPRARIAWVIGLDFGTTYSGFAYARVSDDPEIHVYYDWPSKGNEKAYCKTLTGLYYKRTSLDQLECASWGYLARSEYVDHRGSQHGRQGLYLTKFKLLLKKDLNDPALAKSIPSPLTATGIITDYLKLLGEHALSVVQNHVGDAMFSRDSVQWCVTVPSIWDDNAKLQMKACMVKAGLVSVESGGIDAVKVVLEPEAASFHCHQVLREKRKDVSLHAKDKILVADVGGGTVDLVVQELMASGREYKVKELTESSGGLCGGTFVDESFMRFLSKKIGCLDEFLSNDNPSYKARLLKDWEEIKSAFGHEMMCNTDTKDITLHSKLAAKWEVYEMNRGNTLNDSSVVELTEQDMKSIFDPVVKEILELIAAQLRKVPDIKVMFVVGGFAGSPYLMQRIRARFSGEVKHIVSPPSPGSAIVQGAVSLALHPEAIVSRISKKTYGTSVILPFDPNLDPNQLLEVTKGVEYCRNRFDVFVKKGSRVEFNMDVTKKYRPHAHNQRQMTFDLYSSTEQDPRHTEGDTVTKEGRFAVTLPQKYSKEDMEFKFTMHFGRSSIELRVEALFKNGRGQKAETLELPIEYFS